MGLFELILIGLVFAGIVVYFSRSNTPQTPLTEALIDWKAIAHHTVQDAIEENNKIEAIKAYKELTAQGLKESKFAIEYAMEHGNNRLKDRKRRLMDNRSDDGLRDLIIAGKIEEAVEIYQKFAGVDKFSAQDAIQQLQEELERESSAQNQRENES